ncbi:MAG: hypothetical protein V1749_09190 [Candidatus Desantisbacteria bacterium]
MTESNTQGKRIYRDYKKKDSLLPLIQDNRDGSPLFESLRLVESAIFPLRKGG